MDFDQAEVQRPVQQLELTPNDLLGNGVVGLSYVKYQNVQNLTVSKKVNVLLDVLTTLIALLGCLLQKRVGELRCH